MVVGRSVPRRRPLGRARPGAPASLPRVFYSPLFLSSSGLPPVDGPCVVRINIYLRSISKIDDLSMVSMVQGSLCVVRYASSERYATLVSSKDLKQEQSSVSLQVKEASWEFSSSHCSLLAVRGVLCLWPACTQLVWCCPERVFAERLLGSIVFVPHTIERKHPVKV